MKDAGTDKVIDFTLKDFGKRGETCDMTFATLGQSSFSCGRPLKGKRTCLFSTYELSQLFQVRCPNLTSRKKAMAPLLNGTAEDLIFTGELAENGTIMRFFDRRYPLRRTAEAHRYVEMGQKREGASMAVAHDDRT